MSKKRCGRPPHTHPHRRPRALAESGTPAGSVPAEGGDILLQDILDQPRALADTLSELRAAGAPAAAAALRRGARVVLTGMGASYFACYPAALRLWQAGIPAVWIEAGELLHHAPALCADSLLVLVTQSGGTAEIVHLIPRLPASAAVVAVTNTPDSPTGRAAGVVLALRAGRELAVCATKTYTSSLLALDLLADALIGEGGAPARWTAAAEAANEALERRGEWFPDLEDLFAVPEHLWLLGRGPGLSAASCGALIIKESSRVHAEGMSVPQFRHGPLEGALPGRCALALFSPGPLGELDRALAREMAAAGMTVAAVADGTSPAPAGVRQVNLPAVPPGCEPAIQALPAQLLGRAFARRQGRDPGRFTLIGKVTDRE